MQNIRLTDPIFFRYSCFNISIIWLAESIFDTSQLKMFKQLYISMQKIKLIHSAALETADLGILKSISWEHFWPCPTKNLQTIFYVSWIYAKNKSIHQFLFQKILIQKFCDLIEEKQFWPNLLKIFKSSFIFL